MAFSSRRTAWIAGASLLLVVSCGAPPSPAAPKITVAAAANLTIAMEEIGAAFQKQSGIAVVMSYGATAQLAQQIENGAPFDVFAAADAEHIDKLVERGEIAKDSRAVYARGQLALWIPGGEKAGIAVLKDLKRPSIRAIAIAQPALAPYGQAAVEALKSEGLWDGLQRKVVYANDIRMARQYADTGNAEAAFTAFSLVLKDRGSIIPVDPQLYKPIEQAMGVVASSKQAEAARKFTEFLLSSTGQAILSKNGYLAP